MVIILKGIESVKYTKEDSTNCNLTIISATEYSCLRECVKRSIRMVPFHSWVSDWKEPYPILTKISSKCTRQCSHKLKKHMIFFVGGLMLCHVFTSYLAVSGTLLSISSYGPFSTTCHVKDGTKCKLSPKFNVNISWNLAACQGASAGNCEPLSLNSPSLPPLNVVLPGVSLSDKPELDGQSPHFQGNVSVITSAFFRFS